jgi:colanic acid biosynthesis glycosyl transferase WcaI
VTERQALHILLVNQYFWPDIAATAQLLADLAEDLAAAGFVVSVLTGKGRYGIPGGAGLPAREDWRGVAIRRVSCTSLGRISAPRRLTDYVSFFIAAGARVLIEPRVDVVVCLSTPPLVAILGILARLRGSALVYKVEDLYPDLAVALGVLRPASLATRLLAGASRSILRRAELVVALDETMRASLLARGARQVAVVPNWADGGAIAPDRAAGDRFRERYGLRECFVVLYSGNHGLAHRFDAVTAAAATLARTDPKVRFLFVGGGPRAAEVRSALQGLPNALFLDSQPRETLRELYNAADVHLVTLRDEVAGLLFPSKYAAALAAGMPVLLVGGRGTSLQQEVEREGLGWACPHSAEAVVAAIREALAPGPAAAAMGARGRLVFEARYERRKQTAAWAAILGQTASAFRSDAKKDGNDPR